MTLRWIIPRLLIPLAWLVPPLQAQTGAWWNDAWTVRKTVRLDTTQPATALPDASGPTVVLLRLFDGNFTFNSAQDAGGDLRFVADDQKTLLPHHVERFDRALNEAFVWIKLPDVLAAKTTTFYLYSGNPTAPAPAADANAAFDPATSLVYHFSEPSGPPLDATGATGPATSTALPVTGSLIAGGIRLTGQTSVIIPASAPLAWNDGGSITWSAWIKPAAFRPNAIIFSRREEGRALVIGEDAGVPFAEVATPAGSLRTPAGPPLKADTWHHLAVTAGGGSLTVWVDGDRHSSVPASLPALSGPSILGSDGNAAAASSGGFNGELDELQIASNQRSAGWIRLAALSQGGSAASTTLVSVGSDEANATAAPESNFLKEHLGIFADISKSLTFDGWAVIVLCSILAVIGGGVAIDKLLYINRIDRASRLFMSRWDQLSNDITALDRADEADLRSLGGDLAGRDFQVIRKSPLFHIYHLGAQEIRKRIEADGDRFAGLSGRSIQAIKARLDGGLVDEEEKLNSRLVFLTLSIAGGPYLGLLGTVIGVMITFAVIAKTGEVEVNSIAPGIAGALLATVAGLAVAIPALFSYSYLNSRISSAINGMRKFIDEFITRIAEAYPPKEAP